MNNILIQLQIVLLIASLLFFGCRTETESSSTINAANVVAPEMITVRSRSDADHLCPYQTFRASSYTVLEYCYLKLLDRDRMTLELIPVLAKDLPTVIPITEGPNKGGLEIQYEILDEATWDNGTPINGYDYLSTMKLVFNPAATKYLPVYSEIMAFYSDIVVDETNPKRFSIFTREPNYKALDNCGFYLLPAYAYDPSGALEKFEFKDFVDDAKSEALKKNPVLVKADSLFSAASTTQDPKNVIGNGPYQVSDWERNVSITLTKKENWWGEKVLDRRPDFVANTKAIRFEILPDEVALTAKLKNGEIDIANTISGTAFEELKKNKLVSDNYDFIAPRTLSMNYMGVNCKNPKLSDARVRKALSCLVDREGIVKEIYKGHAQPLYSALPPQYYYAHSDKSYAFNIDKANQLLDGADWKDSNGNGVRDKVIDGKLTELDLTFISTPQNIIVKQMLLYMQDDFKKAGVNIMHKTLEARQLSAARQRGEFDIYTSASILVGDTYEIYQYWHTDSPYNFFGAGNADLDKKIEAITKETDEAEMAKRFIEFQKIIHEEQYLIFLTNPNERMLINKRLKNNKITLIRPNYLANYPHL